jgi:endonuclease YncB( thermonuclease family)
MRTFAVGLLALLASAPEAGSVQRRPEDQTAVLDHVADGDTIAVRIGGRDKSVRLIGIDTPEVYFGVECGGPQASASMKRMLEIGDRVRLIRDRSQDNRDRYDRLLRYVVPRPGYRAQADSQGLG